MLTADVLSEHKAIMTCRVARSFQNQTVEPREKGWGTMDFSSLYFTKEIQDYLHSFQNLLAALSAPGIVTV
jgi:hypothetical protein